MTGLMLFIGVSIQGVAFNTLAQTVARVPEDESPWLKWVIALGLGVVIFTTGFLNAKRTHLT